MKTFFSLILCIFLNLYSDIPIEKITHSLKKDGIDISPFLAIFSQAIAQEKPGFFGYHATTMRHWLFSEIIKQVLILEGHAIPEHFYFLRSPNGYDAQIHNTADFLSKCLKKRTSATIEEKKRFLSFGLLKIIDKDDLTYDDQDIDQLFESLLFFSPIPSMLTKTEATKRLTDFVGEKDFQTWLERRFQQKAFAQYLESVTIWQILEYNELHRPIADTNPWQQKLLVSLNTSLFGNYTIPTESTIHVFIKGASIDEEIDEILHSEIKQFLESKGLPKELGKKIFTQAQNILNLDQGILLQFFDDPSYLHLDQFTFPCSGFNSPYLGQSTLNYLSHLDPSNSPQIRLLITKEILDPNLSWLMIKQHDLSPPGKKAQIINMIKKCIGN